MNNKKNTIFLIIFAVALGNVPQAQSFPIWKTINTLSASSLILWLTTQLSDTNPVREIATEMNVSSHDLGVFAGIYGSLWAAHYFDVPHARYAAHRLPVLGLSALIVTSSWFQTLTKHVPFFGGYFVCSKCKSICNICKMQKLSLISAVYIALLQLERVRIFNEHHEAGNRNNHPWGHGHRLGTP